MLVAVSAWLQVVFAVSLEARNIMYLTGQHYVVPDLSRVSDVTHVALAFMPAYVLGSAPPSNWPLYTSVKAVRQLFVPGTSVMIAIGGWGDDGFETAAATQTSRQAFADNVRVMLGDLGADGVDLDWEYPGGNGEDYKKIPNSERVWEIEAYCQLLEEIRMAIGPTKIISAAVPGLARDMIAFTNRTVPRISKVVDFLNIMSYDLMNRRDDVTKHHTGLVVSLEAIDAYLSNGLPADKANLGFAFYVKWFKTDAGSNCATHPVGCRTPLMEDPTTGADLGQANVFSWHDEVPADLATSFHKAMSQGEYDHTQGGHFFFDASENIF